MGRPFRWLVGSSWIGNLGDGIGLAAGPLIVASQTSVTAVRTWSQVSRARARHPGATGADAGAGGRSAVSRGSSS